MVVLIRWFFTYILFTEWGCQRQGGVILTETLKWYVIDKRGCQVCLINREFQQQGGELGKKNWIKSGRTAVENIEGVLGRE
jgi:hypothetical protein